MTADIINGMNEEEISDQSVGEGKWHSVGITIRAERLTAEEISSRLRAIPTSVARRGERISPNNPQSTLREVEIWSLRFRNPELRSFEHDFQRLLEFVSARESQFRDIASDCEVSVRCAFASENGQSGFVIDSKHLNTLARSGLDLWVDLFPPMAGLSDKVCEV